MKIFGYIFLVLFATAFFACQKQQASAIAPIIDSSNFGLPKRLIVTEFPSQSISTYSIKYDSLNQRLDTYIDDTTTANPYDELISRYLYNSNGYLVSFQEFAQGSLPKSHTINRDAENKIIWIASADVDYDGQKDTSFFNYQAVGANTKITTIVKSELYPDTLRLSMWRRGLARHRPLPRHPWTAAYAHS